MTVSDRWLSAAALLPQSLPAVAGMRRTGSPRMRSFFTKYFNYSSFFSVLAFLLVFRTISRSR
jgi:hypothetical protein